MKTRRIGFTLIELLVVIAIIAILAAILFPVFTSAKKKAQETSCKSNMRQIAAAIQMYVDEWNSCLPDQSCVMSVTRGYVGLSYTNSVGQSWIKAFSHRFRNDNGSAPDGMGRPLNKYIKSLDIFRCKSQYLADPYFTTKPTQKEQIPFVSSYFYKHALNYCASIYRRPIRTSEVTFASRVSILCELAWHGNYKDPTCYTQTDDGPTKRYNSIFIDGHVGPVEVTKDNNYYDVNWYWGNNHTANGGWDVTKGVCDK
ncbi:MAG: type II secretion system protein [Armatimonadota bacterium]